MQDVRATPRKRSRRHARRAALAGMRAGLPMFFATAVWGFVTGIAMVKAGIGTGMAVFMSLIVYAGSAQLIALPLLMVGTPVWMIFLAGMMVNARFMVFGAAIHSWFRALPLGKRIAYGYFNSDMSFVLFMSRFADAPQRGTRFQHWYYTGIALPAWFSWQIPSVVGIYVGDVVPESWSLGFAATLALLAILVPLIKGRPMIVAIAVAAVVAWIGQLLPLGSGLIAAVLVGISAGLYLERRSTRGA